jgi:hypothetical protein
LVLKFISVNKKIIYSEWRLISENRNLSKKFISRLALGITRTLKNDPKSENFWGFMLFGMKLDKW